MPKATLSSTRYTDGKPFQPGTEMKENGRKMLELSQQVLQKVSFDPRLFRKELMKAVQWVGARDQLLLKAWCLATFGHLYRDVIVEVFQHSMRA